MNRRLVRPILVIGLVLVAAATGSASTPEWVNFFGWATFNGAPAPNGSRIEAFDSNSVMCGSFTVGSPNDTVGDYGFLLVYRDEVGTPEDEGADPGESISFTINGYSATPTGSTVWTTFGDLLPVDLDASGGVGINAVELPADQQGNPNDTIRFEVQVANAGTGLNLFGVSASNAQTDFVTRPTGTTYANSGETVSVYFDIVVPGFTTFPDDTVDVISYSVFSMFDTTQKITGAVTLYMTLVDTTGPTEWVNFFGTATYNSASAPIGSRIDAYDPDGVLCGSFVVGSLVDTTGNYGFMSVYGDKPNTLVDEGADSGDVIRFEINGRPATPTGSTVWTAHGDQFFVDLDATSTIAIEAVGLPANQQAGPDDTVHFQVTVRNSGDGIDFYGMTATNSLVDFTEIIPVDSPITYVNPGQTRTLYFDVVVPTNPSDTMDVIDFTVFSKIDQTVEITASVSVTMLATDVGNGSDGLRPGEFALHQNYPNPFNPSTTISFQLPKRSTVMLEIINVRGRTADRIDLGVLPAGSHEVRYDASHLSSGVYFYRLAGDSFSQTKKMILLK